MEINSKNHIIDGYLTINYCKNDRTDHAHFLTHIETGLTTENLSNIISVKAPTIYTSSVNAHILRNYFKCNHHITTVEFGKTYHVYTARGTFFMFTCIRSFYNVGSMILIARGNFGTLIYTGYSCINLDSLMSVNIIKEIAQNQSLTRLYLDCTFYRVPGAVTSLDGFKQLTLQFFKKRPNHFYIHVPIFGLEDLLAQIADGLNEKMVVDERRMSLIEFLGLADNFTLDKTEGRLHIISQGIMKRKGDVLTSQLVVIKVGNDRKEVKNSYMNNGKIHFFTLFPHASDKDCTEIIFKMKPKEFIPINSKFLTKGRRNIYSVDNLRSSGAESNEIISSGPESSEINENCEDPLSKSIADSEEGTSRVRTISKSVVTEEGGTNFNIGNHSETNEKSIGTARRNNTSLHSSKKVKRRKNLVTTDVKKKKGISKLRQMYSNINSIPRKKQFAHTNPRNNETNPEVLGKMTIENNGLLSSLKMDNRCELNKQNDYPSTSSNYKDKEVFNIDISITNGKDNSKEYIDTVGSSEGTDSNDDSDAPISDKADDIIDKETENNVIVPKPKYDAVLHEHTYARRMLHDRADDSSAPILSDEESNSNCSSKTQSTLSGIDDGDDDASNQCDGDSDLIKDISLDEETDSNSFGEIDDNSNQTDSSTNVPSLTNKAIGTPERNLAEISENNNNNTANISEESTKSVNQVENEEEEEDSSDDCIIQENRPDIIELSDSSNDSFEHCQTKESDENRDCNLSSDSNDRLSPSSRIVINKLTLPQKSNNGNACNDSSMVSINNDSNKKMFYLMKLDNFLKQTLGSARESVRTPTMINYPKNLPSVSLQTSSNRPINISSSSNVCSNSLKPRIIYLNSSHAVQSINSHFKKMSTQTVTLGSPCPKAVTPSTSKGLHCQHQTGLKFKTFTMKQYIPSNGNPTRNSNVPSSDPSNQIVAPTVLKTNNPILSNVQSVEPNLTKTSEEIPLPVPSKGISSSPIIPLYNIDDHFDYNHSNSQDSNSSNENLPESVELVASKNKECSSNMTASENLEDLGAIENISQSTESINKCMPGTIKIKSLSELVADPSSYMKAVNEEPPACEDVVCKTPLAETLNVTETLTCGEIDDMDGSDEPIKSLDCGEGLNSNTHMMNDLAFSESAVDSNNSCSVIVCPTKVALGVKKPDSPQSERSESVTAISNRNSTMISRKISKRKPKPKKSVWMKCFNKRRRSNWKSCMNSSSRNPEEGMPVADSSGKPVNLADTENSYPKVYTDFYEFYANHNLGRAECRLLNQFNISESYVTITPHFNDTFYKYDSVKKCYIPSEDGGKDVTPRRKLSNQVINHSSERCKRKLDQTLRDSSVKRLRFSKRLKNVSHRNQSIEKCNSEEVRKRRILRRRLLRQDGANSRKLPRGCTESSKKKNVSQRCKTNKFKKNGHGESICYMTGAERAKLIAAAESVELVDDIYKCPRCDYTTKWRKNVKRHILAVHIGKIPYQCIQCSNKMNMSSVKSCVDVTEKSNVTQRHNGNYCDSAIVDCKCSQCDYPCINDNDLGLHVKHVHAGSNQGSEGNKTVIIRCLRSNVIKKSEFIISDAKAKRAELYEAVETLQPIDGVYRCPRCEYLSCWKKNVKRHVAGMHIAIRRYKSYKCGECSFDAKNKKQLTTHIVLVHMKDKPFACQKCDSRCISEDELIRHMELFHEEAIEGDDAKKGISPCSELENEINETESPDREFINFMDTYAREELLEAAQGVLIDNDVYKCPSCEYTSKWKGKVIRHIASVHILDAAYKCPGCSYQGKDKSSLISHIIFIHMK